MVPGSFKPRTLPLYELRLGLGLVTYRGVNTFSMNNTPTRFAFECLSLSWYRIGTWNTCLTTELTKPSIDFSNFWFWITRCTLNFWVHFGFGLGTFRVGFGYYLHQYDMDQHILNTKQVDHYRHQNKKCILVLDKYLQVLLLIHQNQLVWALLVYESLSVEGDLHYKRTSEGKYVARHLDSTFLAAEIIT